MQQITEKRNPERRILMDQTEPAVRKNVPDGHIYYSCYKEGTGVLKEIAEEILKDLHFWSDVVLGTPPARNKRDGQPNE